MSPSLKSLPLGRTSSEGLAPVLGSAWDSVSSCATLSLWMSLWIMHRLVHNTYGGHTKFLATEVPLPPSPGTPSEFYPSEES